MELTAEELLRGPRGRRLCLELATNDADAMRAVFWSARAHDAGSGSSASFGWGRRDPEPEISPAEVAELVATASTNVTADAIGVALVNSVGAARYWQEPDGRDVLAGQDDIRAALRPMAEAVASCAEIGWWVTVPAEHWLVEFAPPRGLEEHAALDPVIDVTRVRERIRDWRRLIIQEETVAKREYPEDHEHPMTGSWWSLAGWYRHTVSRLPDALALVEDAYGPKTARTFAVRGGSRVLEIRTPEDWVQLCRNASVDVSASRRHDWFRTTGRAGEWVLPDWDAVAEEWDGVHLTVAAYLAGAGRALAVDETRASVIAGWHPDTTFWFTNTLALEDEPPWHWSLDDDGRWQPAAENGPRAAS
ncbi:MAG: hypothetical protein LBE05_00805 [Microbacterium sp.]|jgi:hypothetical protein|nr:hypothetical protein [Microbacterium sp.]